MCTALTYKTKDFYFGRTFDYDYSYGEELVIMPRNYNIVFSDGKYINDHYAIIGMAYVVNDYPLFYDGVNEKGLCMAGLNFVGNAVYFNDMEGKYNVAQYEFILWILSKCASVKEARIFLENVNITNKAFSKNLTPASLHWIIADKEECIVVEQVIDGLKVYDNNVGVLTNNPPFPYQMFSLNNYMHLTSKEPKDLFAISIELNRYSRGMGAIGLPGDMSSQSRFIRASFTKLNSISLYSEKESVSQFFHILGSVTQVRGCCELENGKYEMTIYSSCCNADKGIYYYKTYDNLSVVAVGLHDFELDGEMLIRCQLIMESLE